MYLYFFLFTLYIVNKSNEPYATRLELYQRDHGVLIYLKLEINMFTSTYGASKKGGGSIFIWFFQCTHCFYKKVKF